MPPDGAARGHLAASAPGARGARAAMPDIAAAKLGIYVAALAVALALDMLVVGRDGGTAFWGCGAATLAAVAVGFVRGGAALRGGALAAAGLALAVPIGSALAGGEPLDTIFARDPVWPQILVALFASRVLAEDCEMRFARFWRAPAEVAGPVGLQSGAAALALGAAAAMAFYQGLWWLGPFHGPKTGVTAITLAALTGETAVHRAILFLFFTLVAFLADAFLQHGRDRAALRALRRAARDAAAHGRLLGARGIRELIGGALADFGHVRTMRLVEEACMQVERDAPPARVLATSSFDLFHASARRFVRALLPALPMLGFFGTVVGLATAMAALPTGSAEGAGVDISASLSGLAVKFQTTLLGIMASLVVSALLALLDRGEAALAAECALYVAEADHAG